jgi:WD40 repeat protein
MRELTASPNPNVAAYQLAFSPDGRTLAVSLPGPVRLWDVSSGQVLRDLEVSGVTRLEVSPGGRALLVSTFNNSVFLYDLADGTRTAGPELPGVRLGEFVFAAFSDSGRTLAVYTDQQLALVPLDEDSLRPSAPGRSWPVPAGEVNSLSVSANGRVLAGGRAVPGAKKRPWRGFVDLFGADWKPLPPLAWEEPADIVRVALSPDGLLLAWAPAKDEEAWLVLWEIDSGRVSHDLGRPGEVRELAFSPDGRVLAAALGDGRASVWEVATGALWAQYECGLSQTDGLAFSPDGRTLAVGGAGRGARVILWDVAPTQLPPPPPDGRFILHRFNGDEVYRFESAVLWASRNKRGVTLWFEVKADPANAQRCEDTAELRMSPNAEVGIDLPDLDAADLVGREFSIPGTTSDDEDSSMSLLYYCEHEPLRENRIVVVSRAGDRFRLRWTAVATDVNYYDGSKPTTRVEIEGEFVFKDIGKWVRA